MDRDRPHLPAGRRRGGSAARQAAGPGEGERGRASPAFETPFSFAELELRRRRGALGRRPVLVLALEDPWAGVGSGGATLNAVLVAAEHLSARAGCTVRAGDGGSTPACRPPAPLSAVSRTQVVSADALKEARILILHTVRAARPSPPT